MRLRLMCEPTALSSALLAATMLVSGEAVAMGAVGIPAQNIFDAAHAVSDSELAEMRGGFFTASGVQFDFGASIQTMINGQLALQTNLQWTQTGPITQQLTGLGDRIQSQVNSVVAKSLAQAGIASPLNTTPSGASQTAGANSLVAPTSVPSSTISAAPASTSSPNTIAAEAIASALPTPIAAPAAPASSPSTIAAETIATTLPAPIAAAAAAPFSASAAPASSPNSIAAETIASELPAPISAAAAAPIPSPNITAPEATTTPPSPGNVLPTLTIPSDGTATLSGIQVPGPGGSTQVFANIGAGQIQNIIVNSASGQTITQNTNVSLTIYNYQAWQAQLANRLVAARLATDMLAAAGFSAGH